MSGKFEIVYQRAKTAVSPAKEGTAEFTSPVEALSFIGNNSPITVRAIRFIPDPDSLNAALDNLVEAGLVTERPDGTYTAALIARDRDRLH